ncbi:MAG: hypothetical protein WC107_06280 [Patescibacteria group bacterium]
MPAILFRTKYTGLVPGTANMGQAGYNAVRKEAWGAVGAWWHEHFRPKHFTREAKELYGYQPRQGEQSGGKSFWKSYTGRKQKRFGHTLPLVFAGETSGESVLNAVKWANIHATRHGVKVTYPRAQKLNFRNPKAKSPTDMRKEFLTVREDEIRDLIELYDREIEARIPTLRAQETSAAPLGGGVD